MKAHQAGRTGVDAITIRDVTYSYPDGSLALDGVSLKIVKGERVAVLGPNGAGKSTLLMHMAGLFIPQRGEVTILGLPVNGRNIHKIRRNIGMVFQNPDDQLFCSTVYEDVSYGPLNLGLAKDEVASKTREALRRVGLEGFEDRPPHRLSEGEKKKVAIATVLPMQPKIMIVDEPTSNLDPESRRELIDLIKGLWERQNFTLVVATHDVDLIPHVADRTIILNQGRLIGEGPVRETLLNPELLRKARLELPTITRLFHLLEEKRMARGGGRPLTVDEGLEEIQYLIRELKRSRKSPVGKRLSSVER
ncbi:ATP-binding cassette domain-containing protein [Candidatus Bathyarchaeota archaeon]|nr:ATP-binding cassette domain-containing protein [Candidatus Bathyarchaeota archaeon]